MLKRALCLFAAIALSACSPDAAPVCPNGPDGCVCQKATDCGPAGTYGCLENSCKKLCLRSSDCAAGLVCEDQLCKATGCGGDAECLDGQQCLAGECRTPIAASAVASCFVQPDRGVVNVGRTKVFSVSARQADGRGIAYKGEVTWESTNIGFATVSGTSVIGTVSGAGGEGAAELRAKLPGGVTCAPARLETFGLVPAGKVRVIAADLQSGEVIAGAKVAIDRPAGRVEAKTDARGRALFDLPAGETRTVSVFEPLHSYVTYTATKSNDLLLFLKPFPSRNGFTGAMPKARFDQLQRIGETVHLAIFGSSLPGNILDLQAPTIFGDMIPTEMVFGQTTKVTVDLPSGVVVGSGEEMFRDRYDVFAAPGLRTVWGLGGNANFNELFRALAPILVDNEANVGPGKLVNILLPLVNRFQSGVATGLKTPPNAELAEIDVRLDTELRLRFQARVPTIPPYKIDGVEKRYEGAVVVGGALNQPQGLVPLGLTAGVDKPSETAAYDGKVTNPEVGGTDGILPIRIAPLHGGLESSRYAMVALAASFSDFGSDAPSEPQILSGLVALPDELRYSSGGTEFAFPRGFMGIPGGAVLNGRNFRLGDGVDGANVHRLDIGSAWNGEWQVYFPPGAATFDVPAPPAGYDDRMKVPAGEDPLQVLVQSIGLNTKGGALDYEGVVSFGDFTLDDLTARIDAFSSRELPSP